MGFDDRDYIREDVRLRAAIVQRYKQRPARRVPLRRASDHALSVQQASDPLRFKYVAVWCAIGVALAVVVTQVVP